MLRKGFAFDHFRNGKSLIIAQNLLTYLSDRNVASHVIPRKISMAGKRTQIYGEFQQSHQKFKTQFYTSFCRTSRALYHHSILCSFSILYFGTDLYLDCVENFLFLWQRRRKLDIVWHILFCSVLCKN